DRRDNAEYLVFGVLQTHAIDVEFIVAAAQPVHNEVSGSDRSGNVTGCRTGSPKFHGTRREIVQTDPAPSVERKRFHFMRGDEVAYRSRSCSQQLGFSVHLNRLRY